MSQDSIAVPGFSAGSKIIDQCQSIGQKDCPNYLDKSRCNILAAASILGISAMLFGIVATTTSWVGGACAGVGGRGKQRCCGNKLTPSILSMLTVLCQIAALIIRQPGKLNVGAKTQDFGGMNVTSPPMVQDSKAGVGYIVEILSCTLFVLGGFLVYKEAQQAQSLKGTGGGDKAEPLLAADNYNRL